MRSSLRGLSELLFPEGEICLFCGEEAGECDCMDGIELIEPHACPRCGRHRTDRELYGLCSSCRDGSFFYDANYSAAYYRGTVKKAIWNFKYHDALYLRRFLGQMLYEKYKFEQKHLHDVSLVTYIPISLTRQISRGYNQARELAEVFSALAGLPMLPLLVRKKQTRKLRSLGKSDRQAELLDSMRVREKYLTIIRENKILIIDDIFTTGSTVNEAAKCLKKAGAKSVRSLTLAGR